MEQKNKLGLYFKEKCPTEACLILKLVTFRVGGHEFIPQHVWRGWVSLRCANCKSVWEHCLYLDIELEYQRSNYPICKNLIDNSF